MEPETTYKAVCYGEVLWDILPSGPLPGGAPMNVAYHLNKLGTSAAMISKTGNDDYGRRLRTVLEGNGMTNDYVQTDDQYPTGLVYANMGDAHEVTYDIVQPSAWDFIEVSVGARQLTRSANVFVCGSLSSRSETSKNTLYELLGLASIKVVDINLRPPHYSRDGIEQLLSNADILKMNLAELDMIAGWFGVDSAREDKVNMLQHRFAIQTIIVTLGGDGAMVNSHGRFYHHSGFKVQVADTIGSGDAFLAGFLHTMLIGSPVQDSLRFASAMGAFIATQSGGCPPYDVRSVDQLVNGPDQMSQP